MILWLLFYWRFYFFICYELNIYLSLFIFFVFLAVLLAYSISILIFWSNSACFNRYCILKANIRAILCLCKEIYLIQSFKIICTNSYTRISFCMYTTIHKFFNHQWKVFLTAEMILFDSLSTNIFDYFLRIIFLFLPFFPLADHPRDSRYLMINIIFKFFKMKRDSGRIFVKAEHFTDNNYELL